MFMQSLHRAICSFLILFFGFLLLHTFMHPFMHAGMHHSKSSTVIEGLETAAAAKSSQAVAPGPQADINLAEIATMKAQIATFGETAQKLKTQMIKNEADIQNNTDNIQKVVESQQDMNTKLANLKSAQLDRLTPPHFHISTFPHFHI
jgi:hypothetical protein